MYYYYIIFHKILDLKLTIINKIKIDLIDFHIFFILIVYEYDTFVVNLIKLVFIICR